MFPKCAKGQRLVCVNIEHQNLSVEDETGPGRESLGDVLVEVFHLVGEHRLQVPTEVLELRAALVQLNPLTIILDLTVDAVRAFGKSLVNRLAGLGQHWLDRLQGGDVDRYACLWVPTGADSNHLSQEPMLNKDGGTKSKSSFHSNSKVELSLFWQLTLVTTASMFLPELNAS